MPIFFRGRFCRVKRLGIAFIRQLQFSEDDALCCFSIVSDVCLIAPLIAARCFCASILFRRLGVCFDLPHFAAFSAIPVHCSFFVFLDVFRSSLIMLKMLLACSCSAKESKMNRVSIEKIQTINGLNPLNPILDSLYLKFVFINHCYHIQCLLVLILSPV